MAAPLVTIGLTCFNAADSVERALACALSQDWPSVEVVVVDDASADGSVAAIEMVMAKDPRVRLIRHPVNTGPAGARNTILSEARGEFVAFFDDDDESQPDRISEQVRMLTAYEKWTCARLIACYASGIRRYPNGYIKRLPAIGSRGNNPPCGPGVADYLLFFRRRPDWFYGSGTPACSLLARRSTFAAVGEFDVRLRRVEDADFAIRLALLGGHFIGTTKALFVQHASRGADKSPEKNLEAEQRLANKHRAYLDGIGQFEYAWRWPKLRFCHFKHQYGRFFLELAGLLFRYPRATAAQLWFTGPRRFLHEKRIGRG
jgi:glycosyltransferase involved in cell wall biosynthesis